MLNVKRNPFECDVIVKKPIREHRIRKMIVKKDVVVNGVLKRVNETTIVDMDVPRTPQTGLDTRIGDIAYYVQNNMTVEHNPAYMSNLGSNPFALESLRRSLDGNFSKFKSQFDDLYKNVESYKN